MKTHNTQRGGGWIALSTCGNKATILQQGAVSLFNNREASREHRLKLIAGAYGGASVAAVMAFAKVSMIVALARKLLIALWRMVTIGEIPEGIVLRTPLN